MSDSLCIFIVFALDALSAEFDTFEDMIDKSIIQPMLFDKVLCQAIVVVILMQEDAIDAIGVDLDLDDCYWSRERYRWGLRESWVCSNWTTY